MFPSRDPPRRSAEYQVSDFMLADSSDEELEKWASDANCLEKDKCATHLAERRAKHGGDWAAKRKWLQENPFDPRTEVSADARHIASKIVTHLWILFVLLPFIIGVLLVLLGLIK